MNEEAQLQENTAAAHTALPDMLTPAEHAYGDILLKNISCHAWKRTETYKQKIMLCKSYRITEIGMLYFNTYME
jgi:hypothetical protein